MSRFPARRCIMEYEIIVLRQKKTAATARGNLPDRRGNIHLNLCANHYQL